MTTSSAVLQTDVKSRDQSPARAAWARLAPALLLSLAVHTAAITSLDRYAAPLGAIGDAGQSGRVLSVALTSPAHPAASTATGSDAATTDGVHIVNAQKNASKPANAAQGMPLATYFFAKGEVDRPATAINDVLLRYPREAFSSGTHGTVILEVFIDADGSVVRTSVIEAVPPGIFEDAAQDAISQLRYRPAQRGGSSVRSRRLVQVVFDPNPALLPPRSTSGAERPHATHYGGDARPVSDQ